MQALFQIRTGVCGRHRRDSPIAEIVPRCSVVQDADDGISAGRENYDLIAVLCYTTVLVMHYALLNCGSASAQWTMDVDFSAWRITYDGE